MDQNFNKRYVVRFTAVCVGLFIVASFLPFPGIFNLLLSGGAAFYVGRLFAKDHNRVPDASEQNRFALKAFVALVVVVGIITAILVAGLPQPEKDMFFAPFRDKSISAMIVGAALAVLMMWGSIHFGFGLGGRLYMKKVEKEQAKSA